MRDRTTSAVAAVATLRRCDVATLRRCDVAAVATLRITSASAGLMSSHLSRSFMRGSMQVRIATFGAGLFASEGSWCSAVLRFAAIALSIKLIWNLLNRTASPGLGLRQHVVRRCLRECGATILRPVAHGCRRTCIDGLEVWRGNCRLVAESL